MPLKKKRANQPDDQPDSDDLDQQQIAESDDTSDDDDEDDEEEGLEGTYDGNEEIQVDFEGRNPVDSDFHGIRQLLRQLLLKAPVNLSALSDVIIGQNYIGSVVTQCVDDGADNDANDDADNDDEDEELDEANTVFGITTAINMTQRAELGCVKELREHLLVRADRNTSGETLRTVRKVLGNEDGKTVAFLLNERFVNIPPQISVPLLENLAKEVGKAAAKGMPYKFDYYVLLVKLYRAQATKGGKKGGQPADEFYTNAEEEVFVEQALCSFEYSVKGEATEPEDAESGEGDAVSMAAAAASAADDSGLVPFRKLVIFEASKLSALIGSIKKLFEP